MQDSADKIPYCEKQLKSILEHCDNIVVAIYGDWGVGKTHFWKAFCDKYYKNQNIYISLIGKSDIVSIKESLVLNLARQSGFCKIKQKIKDLRFALNLGIVSFNSSVSNLFDLISKENFSNQIICFDDMERMDSAILKNVLGLINELKEHKNCKIVLIFNKNKLNSANFFEKDKIIDREIAFNPSVEFSFQIAKNDANLTHIAENIIRDYCTQKYITNIRVIRRIFDDFIRFEKETNCDFYIIAPQILDILVRFSAINAMKMGIDLNRLHLFYFVKCLEIQRHEKDIDKEFSDDEIAKFEPLFYYMENLIINTRLEPIANIIAKFINAEPLSNDEKAEIVGFRL